MSKIRHKTGILHIFRGYWCDHLIRLFMKYIKTLTATYEIPHQICCVPNICPRLYGPTEQETGLPEVYSTILTDVG